MRTTRILLTLVALCFVTSSVANEIPWDRDTRFNLAFAGTGKSVFGKRILAIYEEIFDRLNIDYQVVTCKATDCSLKLKQGIVDGEMVRTKMYQRILPDASIILTESIASIKWSAFSTDKMLKLNSFEDLSELKLKIASLTGHFYVQQQLDRLASNATILRVIHAKVGLSKLIQGDVDVFVGEHRSSLEILSSNSMNTVFHSGVLTTQPLYTVLAKKHAALAAAITKVIRNMKHDGTLSSIGVLH